MPRTPKPWIRKHDLPVKGNMRLIWRQLWKSYMLHSIFSLIIIQIAIVSTVLDVSIARCLGNLSLKLRLFAGQFSIGCWDSRATLHGKPHHTIIKITSFSVSPRVNYTQFGAFYGFQFPIIFFLIPSTGCVLFNCNENCRFRPAAR